MSKKRKNYSTSIPTSKPLQLPPRRRVSAIDRVTQDFIAVQKAGTMYIRYLLLYNLCVQLERRGLNNLIIECEDRIHHLSISHYFDWTTTYEWHKPIISVRPTANGYLSHARFLGKRVWDTASPHNIFMRCYIQQQGLNIRNWQIADPCATYF